MVIPSSLSKSFSLLLASKQSPIHTIFTHTFTLIFSVFTEETKLAQTWFLLTADDSLVKKGQELTRQNFTQGVWKTR